MSVTSSSTPQHTTSCRGVQRLLRQRARRTPMMKIGSFVMMLVGTATGLHVETPIRSRLATSAADGLKSNLEKTRLDQAVSTGVTLHARVRADAFSESSDGEVSEYCHTLATFNRERRELLVGASYGRSLQGALY